MNEVYESEAYIQYATEQAAQTEAYFGLGDEAATDETDDSASIEQ
jgi:hypothetical protein